MKFDINEETLRAIKKSISIIEENKDAFFIMEISTRN